MKRVKRILALLLCAGMLLQISGTMPVKAAASMWVISEVALKHEKISFTVSQVDKAQNATLVVLNSQEEEILTRSCPITNQKEDIVIDLQGEECLLADSQNGDTSTVYYLYLKDEEGNIVTERYRAYLQHHRHYLSSVSAYPNWVEIKDFDYEGTHVSATVNFQEYQGVKNEDGTIIIDYPDLEDGTYVELKWWDDYGCSGTHEVEVESESYVRIPGINIFRNSTAITYDELYDDRRLAVKIGDDIYYSSYGAGTEGKAVVYPEISADVSFVTVWVECKNGSRSEEENYNISDCVLEDCGYNVQVYPGKAVGTVRVNAYGQAASSVATVIGGRKYQADIKNGAFTLVYPAQKGYSRVLTFTDGHGCSYSNSYTIRNSLDSVESDILVWKEEVLRKSASAEVPEKDIRMCAKVGGKNYYSRYSNKREDWLTVSYPQQAIGTKISIWFEHKDTSFTGVETYKVYNRPMKYSVTATTVQLSGKFFGDVKPKVTVTASGKEYKCKVVQKWDSYDDPYYKFSVSYPRQKVNSYLKIRIADDDGYSRTAKIKLKNITPKLTVSSVDSGSLKIAGKTVAGSKVTAQINGKNYKGKANKSGKYTIKIKQAKVGTKIKVSVVTPEGYTGSKTVKVKLAYGYVSVPKYIYKTSNRVTVKVQEGQKGDKIKVNVGGKTYTKTLKKTKKTQNVTVGISPAAAGTGVVIQLTDKFGKVKSTYRDMVYFGDTIYIGMTAEEACLTTWGTPKRNNWGGTIQWVYRSGSTTLYVYIVDGKVSYIQKLNY